VSAVIPASTRPISEYRQWPAVSARCAGI
jgi:hypothetical protein